MKKAPKRSGASARTTRVTVQPPTMVPRRLRMDERCTCDRVSHASENKRKRGCEEPAPTSAHIMPICDKNARGHLRCFETRGAAMRFYVCASLRACACMRASCCNLWPCVTLGPYAVKRNDMSSLQPRSGVCCARLALHELVFSCVCSGLQLLSDRAFMTMRHPRHALRWELPPK